MAKFCGHCGAPLDDDARVCGRCGSPVDDGGIPGVRVVDPERQKKRSKQIKTAVALLIVVILVFAGIGIVRSLTGTNGLIRKVMAAYQDYDIDALVDLSSDVYYYSDYEDYVSEYFEYAVGSNIDSFEESVGHSYKLSYEIEEVYELSERKQEEFLSGIEFAYPDFDVDTISKIVVAELKVSAKQGSKSAKKDVEITMTKEGSAWKLLYLV